MHQRWFVGMGLVLPLLAILGAAWPAAAGPKITVQKVWAQPLPAVAVVGAFYMIIRNTGEP